jgi:hypothetical protein
MTSNCAQSDVEPATNVSARKRPSYWRKDTHTTSKFRQTGSKKEERVGYAVIWNDQKIKKRVRPQNTITAPIITAIHSTMKDPRKNVIVTYSLSTLMASSDKKETKNPETQTIKTLIEQEVVKITLLWGPSHVGIHGNKEAAKDSFDENVEKTEQYVIEEQQRKWEQTDSEMRNQKQQKTSRINTSTARKTFLPNNFVMICKEIVLKKLT